MDEDDDSGEYKHSDPGRTYGLASAECKPEIRARAQSAAAEVQWPEKRLGARRSRSICYRWHRLEHHSSSYVRTVADSRAVGQRRNTRHRNPLPPTTGPLFPPLPPKQQKNGHKDGSMFKSPAKAVGDAAETLDDSEEEQGDLGGSVAAADDEEAGEDDPGRESDPQPSGSNASLTPPPTSPAAHADVDVPPNAKTSLLLHQDKEAEQDRDDTDQLKSVNGDENGGENGGGDNDQPHEEQDVDEDDDWESYRRHRAVKGFAHKDDNVKSEFGETERDDGDHPQDNTLGVNGDQSHDQQQQHIQVFPPDTDEPEGSNHPLPRTRPKPTPRGMSAISASNDNTPASASESDANFGRAASRQGRKRRGEEQLLLDDHLLPAEIRRTSVAERAKKDAEKDEEEEADVEEGGEEGEEDEEEDDRLGEQEEDEEGKDITRCVCKREG